MKKAILKLSALIMILTITVVPLGAGCLTFGMSWNLGGQGWNSAQPWGFTSSGTGYADLWGQPGEENDNHD